MDNFDIAFFQSCPFDKNINGEPLKAGIDDRFCCFITNTNGLYICNFSGKLHSFVLPENVINSAIQVNYLSLWQVVVIATRSSLLIYGHGTKDILVLHSFTTNITTASWSPNESFLVVVDEENILYCFTFQMNPILERCRCVEVGRIQLYGATLPCEDVRSPNTGCQGIEQGGEKETDKEKDREIQEIDPPNSPPVISWRGNGEHFVINYGRPNRRFLKVFDRNLRAQFESQSNATLLAPTAFKKQGNSIACACESNGDNQIVIFEKNCLVKSKFLVPENKGQIKYLQYHPEMHLLAVYSEDMSSNGFLNIYLNSNAQWYLKQQLVYKPSNKLISFSWTTFADKNMCTLIVLTSQAIERIMYRIIINRYPETNLVAVIDGTTVHFTKFSEAIVPPPMASYSINCKKPITRIFFEPSLSLYQFLTSDNQLHYYFYKNGIFSVHSGAHLPNLLVDVDNNICHIIDRFTKVIDNVSYEVLLDRQQDLLLNGSVVCTNVLSIYIHDNYLLFTHASSKLFCVRLTQRCLLASNWNLNQFYSRDVEQGTKIVCVTTNSNVVVELPRGSLELVFCRVIAIDGVEVSLAQNKWNEAIDQIRRQRLNWNLLIDLNRVRFFEHIRDFIQAAAGLLSTIISEFSNEDCLQTTYKLCTEESETLVELEKTHVLSKMLDEIIRHDPASNLISIVTLQLKHFSVKSALRSVCTVFEKGELTVCKKAMVQIMLDRLFAEMILDAYQLYNVDFIFFLYDSCAADPKSFDPQLPFLTSKNPVEVRLRLNVLAGNFNSATKYLVRVPELGAQALSKFITEHETQSIAYSNTCNHHPHFKLISQLYAIYLSTRAQYDEAGFVLERVALYQEALEEYNKALNWQQVLKLLEILEVEEDYRKEVLLNLAENLVDQKRIDEAVILYEYHCGAHEKAIEVLAENKMFQKALILAKKYNCTLLIDHVVTPTIEHTRIALYERITELGNSFLEYTSRLKRIRQQKLLSLKYRTLESDEATENVDLNSEYGSIISSRASSVGSGSSRGSTLSSRNRRKQERKKTDLREGAVYEDIALIKQLYLLAINIFECGQDVKEVLLTLHDCDSFSICSRLHEKLSTVQEAVRSKIPQIWTETFLNASDSIEPEIRAVIQNRAELDAEYRTPPPPEKLLDNWKISLFSIKNNGCS